MRPSRAECASLLAEDKASRPIWPRHLDVEKLISYAPGAYSEWRRRKTSCFAPVAQPLGSLPSGLPREATDASLGRWLQGILRYG